MNSETRKILVLYVGGTIGMQKNEKGVYVPKANAFIEKIKYHSQMHDPEFAKELFSNGNGFEDFLVIPNIHNNITVIYLIKEYDPLLDSSNMTVKEWVRISKDIEENYENYDGFVVLHGTDTLAYTASALSFMLEGLQKPVIVTGSQIPIFEQRSDAKSNFLSSLLLAGCFRIPEVCVFFADKLLRGNRTSKISSNLLDAFDSPNCHTLADVGINVRVNRHYLFEPKVIRPFRVHVDLNPNVGLLPLFPTITTYLLKSFLQPPIEGVVLQSYGVGNIPSERGDLVKIFKETVDRGVIIVNVTQCAQGAVSASYETGKALEEIGIISGYDMTAEAALAKLSYVLGLRGLTNQQRKEIIRTNIRGELTN